MLNVSGRSIRRLLLMAGCLALCRTAWTQTLFTETFTRSNGLITNEFAYVNNGAFGSIVSPVWETTNGSLFASNGAGWTGVPDAVYPNRLSSNGTSSAAFRLRSRRADFGNVALTLRLLNGGLTSSGKYPAVAWDGAHLWLRYQSEYQMYYFSVNRRDNKVIIKKKVPGGPSNGGTYYDLTSSYYHAAAYNRWQTVRAEAVNNSDGSVTLRLLLDGKLVAGATDRGVGGPPIRAAGRIGIRGDNANLKFDDIIVTALSGTTMAGDASAPLISGAGSTNVTASRADIVWTTNEPADSQVDWGRTSAFGSLTPLLTTRTTSHRVTITGLLPGTRYYYRVRSRDAAGNLRVEGVVHAFTTDAATTAGAK